MSNKNLEESIEDDYPGKNSEGETYRVLIIDKWLTLAELLSLEKNINLTPSVNVPDIAEANEYLKRHKYKLLVVEPLHYYRQEGFREFLEAQMDAGLPVLIYSVLQEEMLNKQVNLRRNTHYKKYINKDSYRNRDHLRKYPITI
jgi:hypothetical protein